jgi:preprotein translocase subunit SecG
MDTTGLEVFTVVMTAVFIIGSILFVYFSWQERKALDESRACMAKILAIFSSNRAEVEEGDSKSLQETQEQHTATMQTDSGTLRRYTRVAMFILWRAFQVMVVIPSSVIGCLLLIYTLNGHSPMMELVTDIRDWAEMSIRPAPAGMVLTEECVPKFQPEDRSGEETVIKPVLCESLEGKLVPFDEYALGMSRGARNIYFFLMGMAFACVVLAYSGRRFIGLSEQPVSAYAPRPRTSQGIDSPSGN